MSRWEGEEFEHAPELAANLVAGLTDLNAQNLTHCVFRIYVENDELRKRGRSNQNGRAVTVRFSREASGQRGATRLANQPREHDPLW